MTKEKTARQSGIIRCIMKMKTGTNNNIPISGYEYGMKYADLIRTDNLLSWFIS
jgi:hypothetical protein